MRTYTIEEALQQHHTLLEVPAGYSMYPLLRNKTDTFVLDNRFHRLHKGDVVLFKRGDTYVLHRILSIDKTGICRIRGDNCSACDLVPTTDILAVMTELYRGKRHIRCGNSIWYTVYRLTYRPRYWVRRGVRYLRRLGGVLHA